VGTLRQLTPEELARAIQRLRNPAPGSKIEAAQQFGIDLSAVAEQLSLSPAERVRRMLATCQTAEAVRGKARLVQK
jgi:hypothetical protein